MKIIFKTGLAALVVTFCYLSFANHRSFQKKSLKIISYNVWHGLTQSGLRTPSVEPEGNKEKRIQHQIKMFMKANADILFLQEVDPVARKIFGKPSLTERYAKALGMDYVSVVDNCGFKFIGRGFPSIYSGLAILATKELQLKQVGAKKLNDTSSGWCSKILSAQFRESRYALSAEIKVNGKSLYLVNTHLHHAFSPSIAIPYIKDLTSREAISEEISNEVIRAVKEGESHRIEEVKNLLNFMASVKEKNPEAKMILAGDFNDILNSETISLVMDYGFTPLADSKFQTWDPKTNKTKQDKDFEFPYEFKNASKKEIQILSEAFKSIDAVSRKIDYIFMDNSFDVSIRGTKFFGNQKTIERKHASDHYGILTEIFFK